MRRQICQEMSAFCPQRRRGQPIHAGNGYTTAAVTLQGNVLLVARLCRPWFSGNSERCSLQSE